MQGRAGVRPPAPARPAAAIRHLYLGISGFGAVGTGPDGRRLRPARARVYGELTTIGTRQLIAAAGMKAADVFFDLGAGVGKVAIGVALAVPGIRCVGIEISSNRYQGACRALHRAEASGLLEPGRCAFRHADLLHDDLTGATVLFANSTCFPAALLSGLARKVAALGRPVTLVTLQDLPKRAGPGFEHVATRVCQTSWNKHHDMHVYRARCEAPR